MKVSKVLGVYIQECFRKEYIQGYFRKEMTTDNCMKLFEYLLPLGKDYGKFSFALQGQN